MKKTIIISTLLFLLNISFSFGQTESIFQKRNNANIEILGHGAFYSLNYERILINKELFKTGAQIGFAVYPFLMDNTPYSLIFSINQLISFNKIHFELGLGQVYTSKVIESSEMYLEKVTEDRLYASFKLGLRYQEPDGLFIYKLAFTPLYDYNTSKFIAWGGIGLGLCF